MAVLLRAHLIKPCSTLQNRKALMSPIFVTKMGWRPLAIVVRAWFKLMVKEPWRHRAVAILHKTWS